MTYTYILQCSDHTLYIGWTTDLKKRLKTHNDGKGAKYTKGRLPVELVYWETYGTRGEAQRREASLRKLSRQGKVALIKKFNYEGDV